MPSACKFTKKWTYSLLCDSKINTWKQLFTDALKNNWCEGLMKNNYCEKLVPIKKICRVTCCNFFKIFEIAPLCSWLHNLKILTLIDLGVLGLLRILIKKYAIRRLKIKKNPGDPKKGDFGKYHQFLMISAKNWRHQQVLSHFVHIRWMYHWSKN